MWYLFSLHIFISLLYNICFQNSLIPLYQTLSCFFISLILLGQDVEIFHKKYLINAENYYTFCQQLSFLIHVNKTLYKKTGLFLSMVYHRGRYDIYSDWRYFKINECNEWKCGTLSLPPYFLTWNPENLGIFLVSSVLGEVVYTMQDTKHSHWDCITIHL